MKFSKQALTALVEDDGGYDPLEFHIMEDKLYKLHKGWAYRNLVFKYDVKYWQVSYCVHANPEFDTGEPFASQPEEIECEQVIPQLELGVKYVKAPEPETQCSTEQNTSPTAQTPPPTGYVCQIPSGY